MEPWQLRAWFDEFLDAANRHDLEALRGMIDPGVRRAHRPAGADAWLAELADLFAGFPDWRWKRILVVVEEDRLAAHLRGSGTHVGPFRGHTPTQRRVNVAEYSFYRVAGGRVVEVTGSGDDEVLSAIGARA